MAWIIGCFVTLEALALIGLLLAATFTGTPPYKNLWPHPAFSRTINIVKPWTVWLSTHPIQGWVFQASVDPEGCVGSDAYGYRHNGNPNRTIDKQAFKIFILGGSTAYGAGVCNGQTIAAHLERILQGRFGADSVQVINAGLGGYYSAIEFLKLSTEIAFQSPNLVISLSGTNDRPYADVDFNELPKFVDRVATPFNTAHHYAILNEIYAHRSLLWALRNIAWNFGIRIRYAFSYANAIFWNKTYMGYLLAGTTKHLFPNTVVEKPKDLAEYSETLPDESPLEGNPWHDYVLPGNMSNPKNVQRYNDYIESYRKVITMTNNVSRALGAEYIYILQPALFTETRNLSDIEAKAKANFIKFFGRVGYDIVGRREYFDDRVRKRFADAGFNFLDLTRIFPDRVSAYVSMNHYSDTGNRLIAERLARLIIGADYLARLRLK